MALFVANIKRGVRNVKGGPGSTRGTISHEFYQRIQDYVAGRPLECERHGWHMGWSIRSARNRKWPLIKCRRCEGERVKKLANNEQYRFRVLLSWIKNKAKARGLVCAITEADLENLWQKQGGKCAISGMAFSSRVECSADRIDSACGYEPDNVHLVTKTINVMKWDLPLSRFVELCRLVADAATTGQGVPDDRRNRQHEETLPQEGAKSPSGGGASGEGSCRGAG